MKLLTTPSLPAHGGRGGRIGIRFLRGFFLDPPNTSQQAERRLGEGDRATKSSPRHIYHGSKNTSTGSRAGERRRAKTSEKISGAVRSSLCTRTYERDKEIAITKAKSRPSKRTWTARSRGLAKLGPGRARVTEPPAELLRFHQLSQAPNLEKVMAPMHPMKSSPLVRR